MVKHYITRMNIVKKVLLLIKERLTVSGIVTAIKSPGQLAINHNAECAVGLKQALVTLK